MPFDEQPEDHGGGGHGRDHDGIPEWSEGMMFFIDDVVEKENLCGFCATTTLANMMLANNLSYLLDEPEEFRDFLQGFVQKAVDTASAFRSARDAED